MTEPSPLALICITMISQGYLKKSGVPIVVKEEVEFFYPLLTGKPIPEE